MQKSGWEKVGKEKRKGQRGLLRKVASRDAFLFSEYPQYRERYFRALPVSRAGRTSKSAALKLVALTFFLTPVENATVSRFKASVTWP